MKLMAIDPGNEFSAYVMLDLDHPGEKQFAKLPNQELLQLIKDSDHNHLCVEMIASYGMAVGKSVFETCVWIGRFVEANHSEDSQFRGTELIYRKDVKMALCHSMKANDSTIKKALIDRYAPNTSNHGKGTKKAPGFFYGFSKDVWQAFAVCETYLIANGHRPV